MEYFFLFCVISVGIYFFISHVNSKNGDHVFKPFPGFAFLFSIYYLFGAWSVSSTFHVTDLPVDQLWIVFTLGLTGFSLTSNLIAQRLVEGGGGRRPLSIASNRRVGADYFYYTFNGAFVACIWLLSLGVTLALWAQSGIPIFSDNVDAARMAVASNGYLGTIAASLDVVSLFCMIFIFSASGRQKDWRFWLCLMIVLSFVAVAVLAGSRSRIFKLLIPAATAYHFTKKPISVKAVLFGLPVGVFVIGFLGYFRANSRWGDRIGEGLPSTIGHDAFSQILYFSQVELSTAIYGLLIVLWLFPRNYPYTYGWLHIGPLLNPFQVKIPIPGNYFKDLIGGTWDGVGLAATFLAPMYAEFGLGGVILLSAVYGFVIGRMYRRTTIESEFRFYRIGTYSIFYYTMLSAMRSDFISFDIIWFMGLCFSIRLFRSRGVSMPIDQMEMRR